MRSKDDMRNRSIFRAQKAKLHRKRVQALENRQKQKRGESRDDDEIEFDDDELDDFDGNPDDDDVIRANEVIALLRRIEWNRKALEDAHSKFKEWCSQSSELAATYRKFTAAGGISADDFTRFLEGRFRHRPARAKRQLRLVSSTKPQPRRLYRSHDDAA
jgi:hypothetical protein